MKKWRQSRGQIPTTIGQVGDFEGGSYFRSLSEDYLPPPPIVTSPQGSQHDTFSSASVEREPSNRQQQAAVLPASVLLENQEIELQQINQDQPEETVSIQEYTSIIYTENTEDDVVVKHEIEEYNSYSYSEQPIEQNSEDVSVGLSISKVTNDNPWSYNTTTVEQSEVISEQELTLSVSKLTEQPQAVQQSLKKEGGVPQKPLVVQPSKNLSHMASTTSLISSQINVSSRGRVRCTWWPGVAALMVAISAAVSLGNILRLPRLVLLHGAGPFLVAYVVVLIVLGLPLVFLEIGLGQFCQQGSLQIYRAVPLLKGVGLVKLAMAVLLCAYYPVLMTVSLFSLVWSAKGPIPFSECSNLYTDRFNYALGISLASSEERIVAEQCLKQSMLKPPEQDAMWLGVNYALLFVLWALLLLSQWGGTSWYRRSTVITFLLTLAALISVLVDGLIIKKPEWPLEWSNWEVLLEPKVWYFAVVQVFFSTQIGFGINVTNAGKIFPKKNAFWVSLFLVGMNLLVGLGAVWVAWLWLKSSSIETPSQLHADIPEIILISLIVDFASVGTDWLPQMWACFACVMIVLAGFVSTSSLLYTLITAIVSQNTAEKLRRWQIVLAVCILGFVASVLVFVPSYIEFVHLLDHYVIGRLVMATTILELIGFAWIYGCNTLYNDFEFVLGQKMNVLWKVIWVIAPVVLLGVELWSIFGLPLDGLPGVSRKADPDWVTITGWSMYLSMWVIVFGTAIWTLGQQVDYNFSDKLRSAIKPSSKWGPADPLHRHGWVRWRTQYSTTGRKDFTLRRRGTRDYTHSARTSPATTLGRPQKNGKIEVPSPLAAVGNATNMTWQTNPSP